MRKASASWLSTVPSQARVSESWTGLASVSIRELSIIARALVKEPKVLLADEPTGNLDEDTRDEIVGLIEKLWRQRGLTLVLVSHDSAVVCRAQRVLEMSRGRLTRKS